VGYLRSELEKRGHETRLATRLDTGERGTVSPGDRVKRARDIIAGFRPDAVHLNNTLAMGWSAARAARKEGVRRIVWTFHDYRFICPNTLMLRPDLNQCDDLSWCDRCAALPKLAHYDHGRIRKNLEGIELVAISEAQREIYRRQLDVRTVIHWDADPDVLAAPPAPDGKPFSVLFAGRKDVEKGFDFCLQAVKRLQPRFPEIRLHLAGRSRFGDERQRIEAYGLSKVVVDHGALPRDRYLELLRKIQAVVCASVWAEPFNLSLLESMAAGKPVVATRSGAQPEVAGTDGALLVDARSSAALMNGLERIFTEPELRQKLAAGGRRRAAEFQGCAGRYEKLFFDA